MTTKTGCQCEMAGYCNRHSLKKAANWHALCQSNERYFRAWEKGKGPGQRTDIPEKPIAPGVDVKELQREHWGKIHSYKLSPWDEKVARDWFSEWQQGIPNIGCGCMSHWRELVTQFPVDLSSANAFFAWGVESHNRVNKRLGKKHITIEEAILLWQQ